MYKQLIFYFFLIKKSMSAFSGVFKQVYSEICSPNHEKINGENQSCILLLKLNFLESILTANFRTLFVVNLFINNFINLFIDLFKSFGHKFLSTSISMLSFITKLYVSELEAVFLHVFRYKEAHANFFKRSL